ncbi:MAG: (2Fe-2S)-binding protein [Elusimicrobiota bacterium]|jgi:carbon-monoxide dehydrogenase small subunit
MIRFTVNGRKRSFSGHPFKRLIDVLREDLGLTGTKEGCGEGECGACTVLVDGQPMTSCIIPICQMAGRRIETVESLSGAQKLSSLQQSFVKHAGAQCGFCTPGILMTASTSKAKKPEAIRQALAGHLCRCTGYQPIVDSVAAAKKTRRSKP